MFFVPVELLNSRTIIQSVIVPTAAEEIIDRVESQFPVTRGDVDFVRFFVDNYRLVNAGEVEKILLVLESEKVNPRMLQGNRSAKHERE